MRQVFELGALVLIDDIIKKHPLTSIQGVGVLYKSYILIQQWTSYTQMNTSLLLITNKNGKTSWNSNGKVLNQYIVTSTGMLVQFVWINRFIENNQLFYKKK